ncbi:LptF/LptG family permease [Campylobacter hepaticus]|uniref:LptF/LptG family permease n=1 Tax=Campylobacter hepaticus TaxID=1813019 RepID=UPI0018CA2A4B|nr:LptF/LptG family permease [Campylobacter hepaticus]MCZ0772469.1 LptF/LptG family permease [Campylobacter hepaticus]MCZ0773937.1 LptF/LptG family permease [Campylobacter hepaticus]MCZ0775189.1 LptF/LptG family permease [Campylobacter hepaticus]QPM44456.1 LptF/LptG family permease [Campylobacter hepaticus]WAP50126.1 LptF/LptG family permease [Campylobacter hepaticus]
MKLSLKYILNQFLSTNLSIFFVLFSIVSMVFFIQLAKLTSSIEISFLDLLKLYGFMLPRILIFTLPISFFISLTLVLYRLSKENESIVLFTLGFSPVILAKFFIKIASLISVLMLIVALVMIPIVFELQNNFINYKSTQVKFNYKTGEFGQKFLDWMIFIEKQYNNKYENIIMYHPKRKIDDKEQLIIAKEAYVQRKDDGLAFSLNQGKIYNFERGEDIFSGEFDTLVVNTQFNIDNLKTKKFYEYWNDLNEDSQRAREFVIYVTIALFPLASTLFTLCFGLVTYRYEKGYVYLGMFGVIAVYFGLLSSFSQNPILVCFGIFSLSFFISFLCFKKMILSRY